MSEPVVILCALALIVLGYGIRLLQEAGREMLGARSLNLFYSGHSSLPLKYDWTGADPVIVPLKSQDDYIDWNHPSVPNWAYWYAVDEDGTLNYFQESNAKPVATGIDWSPGIYGYEWTDNDNSAIIGPLPPWRESLRRRPGSPR